MNFKRRGNINYFRENEKRVGFRTVLLSIVLITCLKGSAFGYEKGIAIISRSLAPYEAAWEGFKKSFPFDIEKANMQGDMNKAYQIMREISSENTDLVVTIGTEAAVAAQKYLNGVPIVYTMVLQEQKFTDQQVMGVIIQVKMKEQMITIRKLFPEVRKIGVLYHPAYSAEAINRARQMVLQFGVSMIPIAVENQQDIPAALTKLTRERIDIIWSVIDPVVARPAAVKLIILHSLQEKIPFIGLSRFHVQAGALAAFSVDYQDIGAQTAELAIRLLKSQESKLVEFPRCLVMFVNSRTLEKLGIKEFPRLPGLQVIQD